MWCLIQNPPSRKNISGQNNSKYIKNEHQSGGIRMSDSYSIRIFNRTSINQKKLPAHKICRYCREHDAKQVTQIKPIHKMFTKLKKEWKEQTSHCFVDQ